jgi:transposase
MVPGPEDHDCGWKQRALELEDKLSTVVGQLEALNRQVFGKKSEKMPPMDREVRKKRPPDPAVTQERRRKNAELRATRVVTNDVQHAVPADQRRCPYCESLKLKPVGQGKESFIWDYVPGYFRRQRHVRETLACTCGQYIVTTPGPDHSVESTRYGDGLRAYIVTSKCADSLPLYRLAKQFARLGIPIARSTLTDLFHQVARQLAPLSARLVQLVAASEIVLADETPLKMQHPDKKGYVWTFIADNLIVYRFSPSRSGETPAAVLGDSTGALVVDMYTGYNEVTSTGKRTRSGCLAHARRKLFDALSTAPEAKTALDFIRDIYLVEHDAKAAGVVRTTEHLRMRRACSKPLMDRLHAFLTDQQPVHLPKGPMGKAISYILGNWRELTRFLEDARLPPDNNRSYAVHGIRAVVVYWGAGHAQKEGQLEPVLLRVLDGFAEARIRLGLAVFKLRLHPILKRLHVRGAFGLVKSQAIFGRQSALPSELVLVVDFAQGFEDETALLGRVGDDIHVAAARMRKAIGQDGAQRR